jgi:cytoskeletal protein RodZ
MPEPEQVRSLPPEPEPPAFDLDAAVGELGWTGGLLRRVREERAMSLRDLGEATRITARYLEAIEGDLFDQLPSSTFVKGYLREIARVLQLDEAALVKGYMRRMS